MSLNIPVIADMLNELAPPHPIGKLQAIRQRLKKLNRRPGISLVSTFGAWERERNVVAVRRRSGILKETARRASIASIDWRGR